MLTVDAALEALLAGARPPEAVEHVRLEEADGRILAEDVQAGFDVPGDDRSAMDGYAVRAAEIAPGRRLPVSQRIAAGGTTQPLAPGSCARIFTGAPLPLGADAVIMQEEAQADAAGVAFERAPAPDEWVIRRGADIAAGHTVLRAGSRLTPQALGLAASLGHATLPVRPRLRVALFSTGDELRSPGEPLVPGAIYNSNRYVLAALLRRLGCVVDDLGIVEDALDATRAALRRGLAADLVLTCGGVSVGEEDHVKAAVEAEGRLDLWRIAVKPGKPLAFGQLNAAQGGRAAHFIGLPGNPVSAFVTFLIFVRPFLLKAMGATVVTPRTLTVPAAFAHRGDRRREFLRARLDDQGRAVIHGDQRSAVLTSTVWGDGLIDMPSGAAIEPGQPVRFLPFSDLLA
ncbi:molybdopterin molybdotransferase MoeA [Chitinasiproducens palmae]